MTESCEPASNKTSFAVNDAVWVDEKVEDFTPKNGYSIGDLAREFGLTLRALRFYEGKGLIRPRRAGPTRFYGEEDRLRLALVLQGKRLGFTLAEVRALIPAQGAEGDCRRLKLTREQCIEQVKLLEQRKRDIEAAIAELRCTYTSIYIEALASDFR